MPDPPGTTWKKNTEGLDQQDALAGKGSEHAGREEPMALERGSAVPRQPQGPPSCPTLLSPCPLLVCLQQILSPQTPKPLPSICLRGTRPGSYLEEFIDVRLGATLP